MATARGGHTASVLANGKVLVAGGSIFPSDFLASAELFDLVTTGSACTGAGGCTSGFCVDGVCCNTPCTGLCMACANAKTGQADGTCAPVKAGTDPDAECKDDGTPSCQQDGFCDGSGACEKYASSIGCSANKCAAASDCTSGLCIDGVCCNAACTETCKACTAAKKASGIDGICDAIADGLDPDAECTASIGSGQCAATGVCSGKATCRASSQGTDCGQASCNANGIILNQPVCDGTGTCPATGKLTDCTPYACVGFACRKTCASAFDCAPGYHCDGGQCFAPSADGAACKQPGDCASGNCIDTVCCHTACTGTCEWCGDATQPGVCVVVAGSPKGAGKSCTGTGKPCDPTCDGTRRDGCTYPAQGTSCGAGKCQGDSVVGASTCDGAGTCAGGATQDCGDYTCKNGACLTSCATSGDCKGGAVCDPSTSTCSTAGATCQGAYSAKATDGTVTYCNGYKCVAGSGCQQTCAAATDCDASQGYACAGGLCVRSDGGSGGAGGAAGTGGGGTAGASGGGTAGPSPATPAADSSSKGGCGCRVPGRRSDSGVLPLGLLLAGATFARARRRRVR
jgi:hypothetical protein